VSDVAKLPPVTRRTALKAGSVVLGGALFTSSALLTACSGERAAPPASTAGISADDAQLLEEIADTILPTTPGSPGAKAAGVAPIVALLVNDCYDAPAQRRIRDGLQAFRALCADRCGGAFTRLSPSERETLLAGVDAEAVKAGDAHWFHLARELSLRAYFSSETGMTQALRYVRVPGRWTGCLPLQPGQPAWG
jgi:hypothetical protein